MVMVREQQVHGGIWASIVAAAALLLWDVAFSGWFGASLIFCPIWFLVSVFKNAIQRPGWRLAIVRTGIPVFTLGLAWANGTLQITIAEANAPRLVAACEEYHALNGRFPEGLDELVPHYIRSVPRAKYCVGPWCQFDYFYNQGKPMLVWYVIPPHYRKIYYFETRRWNYIE
ncbi:MAG: hypothetical protein LC130_35010 [Bryobacterales bacterium]|nr:hypothetical protein [Bryobacterales bacterium]